jgi:hypothetical protein
MEPNENETSTVQRLLIGAATLIVIVLTVGAAVYLAVIQQPEGEVAVATATPSLPGPTSTPSATFTLPALPNTATPTNTASPDQVEPTVELTEEATTQPVPTETATATPTPTATPSSTATVVPPTATATPAVVVQVTAPLAPSIATPNPCRPADWLEYGVQPGDTLDRLARAINFSQVEIAQRNCLSPSAVLQPGQIIYLPRLPGAPTPTNTATPSATPSSVPAASATPIEPVIVEVDAQAVNTANPDIKNIVVVVLGRNFQPRTSTFTAVLLGPTQIKLEIDRDRSNSTSFQGEREVLAVEVESVPAGTYDLVVTNPDGRSDTARGVFPRGTPTPTPPPPVILSISPTAGRRSEDVRLTIIGRNFIPDGISVELLRSTGTGTRIQLLVEDSTATSLRALIRANLLSATGSYDLLVINRDNQVDIANEAYEAIN